MRPGVQTEKYVVGVPAITKTAATAVTGNTVTGFGGATNGGIDTLGYKKLVAVVCVGAIAASGGLNFKLQECATDGGTYQDITGAAITALGDTGDNSCPSIEVPLEGRRRFIRGVGTPTTTDSTAFGVLFILKEPISEPVTQLTTPIVIAPTVAAV